MIVRRSPNISNRCRRSMDRRGPRRRRAATADPEQERGLRSFSADELTSCIGRQLRARFDNTSGNRRSDGSGALALSRAFFEIEPAQRICEERSALLGYLSRNLISAVQKMSARRRAQKKSEWFGMFCDLAVFCWIKPHRLDGDGQCVR